MTKLQEVFPVNHIEEKFLETMIDPETGEILDEKPLEQRLSSTKSNDQLVDSLIQKAKTEDALIDIVDIEIKNLQKLKKIRENRVENFKKFLKVIMDHLGKREFDLGSRGCKIAKNPPRLDIAMGAKLGKYTKVVMTDSIDKIAITKDLKEGKKVKGCKLVNSERVKIY